MIVKIFGYLMIAIKKLLTKTSLNFHLVFNYIYIYCIHVCNYIYAKLSI